MKLDITKQFDKVVMNPPFELRQDILHVMRAFSMLNRGGKLVSVMSSGITFRQDKKAVAFRDFMEEHDGQITDLPEGSFKERGTGVNREGDLNGMSNMQKRTPYQVFPEKNKTRDWPSAPNLLNL